MNCHLARTAYKFDSQTRGKPVMFSTDPTLNQVVAAKRAPWATSAETQGNWDELIEKILGKLMTSIEGLDSPSEMDVALGKPGVRSGVMECVEALQQLRQAMTSNGEQRSLVESEIQIAPPSRANLVSEPVELGDSANRQAVSSNAAGRLPPLDVKLARREMADYMAAVAHELRNPLVPIRTAAALLGRVRTDEIPRLQLIIERQVTRIAGLIADLVDIARVDSGKLRLQRQVVDMRAIVTEAVDDCRPAMNIRAQHLEISLPSVAIEVDGDPGRLVQIVCNLLDNACKYTPVAGVVSVSLARARDDLSLIVSDNGIGISAEALPHLFERFVQESRATDFNRAGLGIGLAVVLELVQAHGGFVEARSEGRGRGSQFIVTLPAFGRGSFPANVR
jgi:signal transduction histidine kinase